METETQAEVRGRRPKELFAARRFGRLSPERVLPIGFPAAVPRPVCEDDLELTPRHPELKVPGGGPWSRVDPP